MSDRWGAVDVSAKAQENRLRRVAARQGFLLSKSRAKDKRSLDYGVWYLRTKEGALILESKELADVADRLQEPL